MDLDDGDKSAGICEVCGAEDMIYRGSQAMCPHCGTSINTQQSTVVLDETTQYKYLKKILTPHETETEEKKKSEHLQPWKLSEVFQILLLKQILTIETAFNLPKDYREMAVKIWMLYLKATGEAFNSDEERTNCRYPFGWGWIYDPEEGQELFRKMLNLSDGKNVKLQPIDGKLRKVQQQLEAEEALKKMEFEVGGNPLSSSSESEDSDTPELDADDSFTFASVKKVSNKVSLPPETRRYWRGWLSDGLPNCFLMEFNLAICYLPLLYIEIRGRNFSLCDLLEVIHRHSELYMNTRSSLPSWICIRDRHISQYFKRWHSVPPRKLLINVIKQLLILLDVEEIPKFPILSIIDQLIVDLRLPPLVGLLARNIAVLWCSDLTSTPPRRKRRRKKADWVEKCTKFVTGDNMAAGFIVLALILIHGNSVNELKKREALVHQLRKLTKRNDLFSISEWMTTGVAFVNKHRPPREVPNIDAVINPPPVGNIISNEEVIDDVDDIGRGILIDNRAIHKHETVTLLRKKSFVKELLIPFQPLIERSQQLESEKEEDWCFSNHHLCFPRDLDELRKDLEIEEESNNISPLKSQDLFDNDNPSFEDIMESLPKEEDIAVHLATPLPQRIPKHYESIVKIVAWKIYEENSSLWNEATLLHRCILMKYAATSQTKMDIPILLKVMRRKYYVTPT